MQYYKNNKTVWGDIFILITDLDKSLKKNTAKLNLRIKH